MDRWKTHRKFIVLLKIIHLTDKPVATCTRVIGICLFEIHGIFHKFVKGSYYCGRHVQSFNYLLQKARGSVVHLNIPVPGKSRYSLLLVPQVHYRLALCKGI